MEEQQAVFGGNSFADALNVTTCLGTNITEAVDVDATYLDVTAHAGLFVEGIESIAAVLSAGRAQQFDVAHLR